MGKKRYYDEYGNEIRSKPSKPSYQKWGIGLFLLVLIGVGIYIGRDIFYNNESEPIESLETESIEAEEVNQVTKNEETKVIDDKTENLDVADDSTEEPLYTYEDFKGTYVSFEDIPYESGIEDVVFLEDNSLRNGTIEEATTGIGILSRNIIDYKIDENILSID